MDSLVKSPQAYVLDSRACTKLGSILNSCFRDMQNLPVVFLVDKFFESKTTLVSKLPIKKNDVVQFISFHTEPTTDLVDELAIQFSNPIMTQPGCFVAIGGGSTLDTAKAVANVLANPGKSANLQGWDLVGNQPVPKVAIPTISGTGAESSRTAVLINSESKIKLGMNSNFSVFDLVIMDSSLTSTVPRNQYFWTGMDAFIHSFEALEGNQRNSLSDSLANETIRLCQEVFSAEEMMSNENREKLMIASYLGGCAIAGSMVGLVHPVSAALSSVIGTHHCVSNCIAMRAMKDFYPDWYEEFWEFTDIQGVEIPKLDLDLNNETLLSALSSQMLSHTKPLINALGNGYREYLSRNRLEKIFGAL